MIELTNREHYFMACPKCSNEVIMAGKTDLERVTLHDYYCPRCGTIEQADTSHPERLRAMRERWEPKSGVPEGQSKVHD